MNPMLAMKPLLLLLLIVFVVVLFDFKPHSDEDVKNVSEGFKISCESLQKLITQRSKPHSDIDEAKLNSEIFPLSETFVECKWKVELSTNSRHFLLEIHSFSIYSRKQLPLYESSSQRSSINSRNDFKMDSNLDNQFVDEDLCNQNTTSGDEFCSFGFIEITAKRGSLMKACFCPEQLSFNITIPQTASRVWIKVKLNLTDNIRPKISAKYCVQKDKDETLAILGIVYLSGLIVSIIYPLAYYSIQEAKKEKKLQSLNAGEAKLNKLMRKMEIVELLQNKFPHMFLDQPQLMCQFRNILDQSSHGQSEEHDMLPKDVTFSLGQSNPSFHSSSDIRIVDFPEVEAASCVTPKKSKKRKRISKVWRFLPRDATKCHDISCEENSSDAGQTNYKQPQLEAENIENADIKCSIERSSTVHQSDIDDDGDRHQLVKLHKPTPGSLRKDLFSQISDVLKARSSESMFVVSSLDPNTFSNCTLQKKCGINQTYEVNTDPVFVTQTSAELYSLQANSSSTSSEKNYSTFNPSETLEYMRAQDKLSRIISELSSASAGASSIEGQQMVVVSNSITATTTKGLLKSGQEKIKLSKLEDITFLPTRHSTPKQFLTFNPFPNTERAKVTWGDQILLPNLEKTAEFGKANQDTNDIGFVIKSSMNYGESKV